MTSRIGLILLMPVLLLMASCKKDDCEAPPVGENIVGTWKVDSQSGTVVFQEDGTLLDPNDLLISGEVNGMVLDEKTWMLIPGDYLLLTASNQSSSLESEFYIARNDCNRISLEVFFLTVDLRRK
ncbi:MAG: hypothetical protein K9I85_06395 [Saprospiraceae bacterium]|nr:hypothetical protein [Saprospiraceae bacterium]